MISLELIMGGYSMVLTANGKAGGLCLKKGKVSR
jgi:hypothetical protein